MESCCFKHFTYLPATIFVMNGLAWSLQTSATQGVPPKTSTTVHARVPKEQLQREAELKKLMDAGLEAFGKGKYQEAILRFQEALEFTKRLDAKDEEYARLWTTNDALAKMGHSYLQLREYSRAATTYATLLEFRKRSTPFDSSVAAAYENLAVVYAMQGDWAGAQSNLRLGIAYLEDCINHFKTSDGYDPQDIVANGDRKHKARLLMELATVCANQGKFDDAFSSFEEAFQTGDRFKVEAKSLLEVTRGAVRVAELARRDDKLKIWTDREKALQAKSE
jgi:tetratricopeptide (TPR) repeat protein